MKLFQIDIKRLVLLVLPTFLRKPLMFAFLSAMTAPVSALYDEFTTVRAKNRRYIQYNGQVCNLRALLNDELDKDKRRITIFDSEENNWVLAYDAMEEEQLIVYDEDVETDKQVILYDKDAIHNNTGYFIVTVPWESGNINKNNRLRDFLNAYKLVGCRYTITNTDNTKMNGSNRI